MSLTSGLDSPRTPLRRFLDRELSAGFKPLRENFRAQHRPERVLGSCAGLHPARLPGRADLLVDGLLLDFKSTKRPHELPKKTLWQLLGYLLLDTADRYRIDTVGLYLTRSACLVSWPVDDYLALLG